MDECSVNRETVAGDGFAYVGDEPPCGCWDGWHYLGVEEDGEELVEAIRCRRCLGSR